VGRLLFNVLAMVAEHTTAEIAELFKVARSNGYRIARRTAG